jgi:hypothetical protein
MITQINEQQPAMIPFAVDPTGQAGLLPDILGAEGSASMGAVWMHL